MEKVERKSRGRGIHEFASWKSAAFAADNRCQIKRAV
jgi:hypothetical protein